jgi:hypothetical protein
MMCKMCTPTLTSPKSSRLRMTERDFSATMQEYDGE